MPDRPPSFTLTTGPATISDRVRAAQGAQNLSHEDHLYKERFRRLEELVGTIFRTSNDIVLLQGEAVLGLEAALAATVRPGMKVINVASGPYGKGMGDWLRAMGAAVVDVETGFREVPSPEMVEQAVREHGDAEMLAVVHVETPCGTISPLREIGDMCRRAGIVSLVDAVASLGGVDVRTDEWGLDICVAAPEKCLGGPTGLSLIAVSPRAWELVARNDAAPRFSFLSILDWKEKWLTGGDFPYTPSIADVHGTLAACEAVLEEGLDRVLARHAATAHATRAGVVAMGLTLWPRRESDMADSVTAIELPRGVTEDALIDHVRERYGVMISGSEGAGDLVRIGHMGETARSLYPLVALGAVGQGLVDLGHTVDVAQGLAAMLAALSESPNA
jgi:pyridoxamine--pyruvate transaminase